MALGGSEDVSVATYPSGFDPPDRSRAVTRLREAGAKGPLIEKKLCFQQRGKTNSSQSDRQLDIIVQRKRTYMHDSRPASTLTSHTSGLPPSPGPARSHLLPLHTRRHTQYIRTGKMIH
jgi:hypothetical protein